MKCLFYILCALLFGFRAEAQSITVNSLQGTVFCTGDSIDIPYTATGSYTNRNSFTVQISDKSGSFANFFYNVGSKRTTLSSSIRIGIPELEPSTKYRIRVIASEPYVEGTVHDSVLSLGPKPSARAKVAAPHYQQSFFVAVLDEPVKFIDASTNATSYFWEFGPDATPSTSTDASPTVRFSSVGRKSVRFTAYSLSGCSSTWSNDVYDEPQVHVVSCTPSIPNDAAVDSTSSTQDEYRTRQVNGVWVVPGGVSGAMSNQTIYAEPGATVYGDGSQTIYYLKAGAVIQRQGAGDVVLYEDGAGIGEFQHEQRIRCADIDFDYTNAPPYKIQQASVSRVTGSSVSIYPNPATNKLTIQHREIAIREINIRNTLGAEQLFAKPGGLGSTSIDVTDLLAGLYFVDVITERGIETHKIVVRR